ncbi:MAG: SPOR domain-containing protein [Gammaproteobacteria bacterium]|nr:SPOR domain-containing protein [Gammaproteobacteria bacterium]
MKAFFALLLIANIAFAVFQWLLPYEQLFVESRKAPSAEQLQLLSEANTEIVSALEVVAEVEAKAEISSETEVASAAEPIEPTPSEPEILVTEDDSDKRVCYTIGPIKDKARGIEISGRYSGKQITTTLKSSLEKQYMGMMVYIGGHKTRTDALKTADALSAQGVHDHFIIKGLDQPNLLSLGVFGLKKNADVLKARIRKLGFPAETEARYRERTIFWVYAEQSSEDELLRLLKQAEFGDGISQIPTQCLPT